MTTHDQSITKKIAVFGWKRRSIMLVDALVVGTVLNKKMLAYLISYANTKDTPI